MSISILRSKDSTKIEKVKKEFDVFSNIKFKLI